MSEDSTPAQHVMRHLRAFARGVPERPALVSPSGRVMPFTYHELSFAELDALTDRLAHGLLEVGIGRGVKTVLMLKPSEELFVVLIAMVKVGAVPIVIDPGMGLQRMLHCYREVGAEAFIGIPLAHAVRRLRPSAFASIRVTVTSGRWGGIPLSKLYLADRGPFPLPDVGVDDLMILVFTTGSTGPAKAVEYTHGMIDALLEQMLARYPVEDGERGLVTLPLFTLIDLFSGCTAVLAPMDPTRPAEVIPENILSAIETYRVRHMFGSPALLARILPAAAAAPGRIATLQTVVCGGAAAPIEVLRNLRAALPTGAVLHTTYGATEALPISTVDLATLEDGCFALSRSGRGVCVGTPLLNVRARAIHITDDPVERWSDALLTRGEEVGEIVVSGPVVSARYHRSEASNTLHKIPEGEVVWHRTGDTGWIDEQGRIWLCGRRTQRVTTPEGPLHTMQCEEVLNAHPRVYRAALVGVGPRGEQIPVVCIQTVDGAEELDEVLRTELRSLAASQECTRGLERFVAHPAFPVDIRHNAKIEREELAVWAGAKLELIRIPRAPLAVMAIPIVGWLYLLGGLLVPLPHVTLVWLWWIVLFLHLVVHPLQILKGLPVAGRVGHGTLTIACMTTIFGATYWRPLEGVDAKVLR